MLLLFFILGSLTFTFSTGYHYQSQPIVDGDWRGLAGFGKKYDDDNNVQRQQKWNEVKGFFQNLKNSFPNVLFTTLDFSARNTNVFSSYEIDLLVKYSDENDLTNWPNLALYQLDSLILTKLTSNELQTSLDQARAKLASEKGKYLQVFNTHKNVLTKMIGANFPYLTVGWSSFRISAITKSVTDDKVDSKQVDDEILAFLLANTSPVAVAKTLSLTSQYQQFWQKLRPQLLKFSTLPRFVIIKTTDANQSSKQVWLFNLNLQKNRQQTDFFKLTGGAKSQLYYLFDVDFTDLVENFNRYGTPNLPQTDTIGWQKQYVFPEREPITNTQRQQKWDEVRPFFQKVKSDFKDVFFSAFDFTGLFTLKNAQNYRLHLLFANSESEKITTFSKLGLVQLDMLIAEDLKRSDLETLYSRARQKIATERSKYLKVFANYKTILEKMLVSGFPYLSVSKVGDPTFSIWAIARKTLNSKFVSQRLDGEILAFILGNVSPELVDKQLKLIPQSVSLWARLQPRLLNSNVVKKIPIRSPTGVVGIFEINALSRAKTQSDYYLLAPTAKLELHELTVLNFDTLVREFKLPEPLIKTQEQNISQKKKQNNTALTIGLATGGSVVGFGLILGLVYWIVKVRK